MRAPDSQYARTLRRTPRSTPPRASSGQARVRIEPSTRNMAPTSGSVRTLAYSDHSSSGARKNSSTEVAAIAPQNKDQASVTRRV